MLDCPAATPPNSMGIFRKAAHKLHIKGSSGRHSSTGHLKHDYESEPVTEEEASVPKNNANGNADPNHLPTAAQAQVQDAQRPEVQDKSKAGPARLDLEHAPKPPPWAKKGLDSNTTYTLHSSDDQPANGQQQPAGAQANEQSAGNQASMQQAQKNQRAAAVIPDGATKQSPAKQSGGTLVQPGLIGKILLLAWIFVTLIYIQLFKISLLGMILPFLLMGMPTGLGLSWLFFYQLGAKKEISAQVAVIAMCLDIAPSWFADTQMYNHICYECCCSSSVCLCS